MTKLILAASAALLIAGPALAETVRADDAPSLRVSARGVDFSNPAQVQRFYARLNRAIAEVCNADAACARTVAAQAVRGVDKPLLTAMYNASGDNDRAFAGNDQ